MTAKLSASADGTKVTIGTAAEDALQIDATAKTIAALAPYLLKGDIQEQNLAANGYVKLASGLIIQWGKTSGAAAVRNVTFPIPFPNAVLTVVCTTENGAPQTASNMVSASAHAPTVSGFSAAAWVLSGASPAFTTAPCNWLAIGH